MTAGSAGQPPAQPPPEPGQPELLPGLARASVKASQAKARATRARRSAEAEVAATDPVARVLVDVGLAHLDRPFDYAVPAALDDAARPGVRVKVRFAGQDVDGFLVGPHRALRPRRLAHPAAPGGQSRAGPEPRRGRARRCRGGSATPASAPTCCGSPSLPGTPPSRSRPRWHPTTRPAWDDATMEAAEAAWADYAHGAGVPPPPARRRGAEGGLDGGPGRRAGRRLAGAGGRRRPRQADAGPCSACPTCKDVARVDAALTELLGPGHHVTLTADAGPAARYRDFLAVSRGARRIVVGTRAAAFAPVHDLGLVVVWDDGDDLHAEPRAPYPHVRETLLLRAEQEGAAFLAGGFARSVEADHLVRTGWAQEIVGRRERPAGPGDRRDHRGHRARPAPRPPRRRGADAPARCTRCCATPLGHGPVLVQTPARGLRAGAGLRALPHPGPLRPLRGAAGAHQRHHPAGLPLVRAPGRELVLLRVRRLRAARAGAR